MLGGMLAINLFVLPESPWWLVQKGKYERAEKVLASTHKGVPGYDTKHELVSTVPALTGFSQRFATKAWELVHYHCYGGARAGIDEYQRQPVQGDLQGHQFMATIYLLLAKSYAAVGRPKHDE